MFTSSHPQNRIFTSIDFSCDLCKNPSSKGWFYRCSFCEFDTHIASAISNKKADPVPPPDHTLKRQIMEADRKIDYRSQSDELMQLIVQGVESDIERNGQEVVSTAFGLTHLEPYLPNTPPSPQERSRHQDPSTQISEDMTIASYQFSEMCFSIDLLKSYPSADHYPYSTYMEARSQYIKDVPKVEANITSDNVAMPQGVQQLHYPNIPETNPLYRGSNSWYNGAFLGQTGEKTIVNGYESRAGIKDQIPKSNMPLKNETTVTSCLCRILLLKYRFVDKEQILKELPYVNAILLCNDMA
uniref:DC1 domain-containing protein n=1 Tax=Salix viminalis TaxID=40686 RepID=A0A6N2KDK1_SALVM